MSHPEAQRQVLEICDDMGRRFGKKLFALAITEDLTGEQTDALFEEYFLSLRTSLLEGGAVASDVAVVEEAVYLSLAAESARLSRIVVLERGAA